MSRVSAAGTLIGREQELAALRAGLDDAQLGHGRLFLIAGDPGIGKTRLLEALLEGAGGNGARVCWGRCWEAGGAASYWPWAQVLRRCVALTAPPVLGRCLGSGASDVTQLVPELAERLPAPAPTARIESPQARLRLFDSVIGFLTAVAAEGGTLVVAVDDLHAADEASMQLLRRLARNVVTTRLLVVGTYREAELRSVAERERMLASIAAHGETIRLAGLDRTGVAALLERVTGRLPTADLVAEVHRVTGGNPFFVGEAARLMAGEGRRDGVKLPEEARILVRRRLEQVEPRVGNVLSRAALLGQEFELAVLRRLTAAGDDDVVDALASATELRIVDELALGQWSFAHSLLREQLYEQLPPGERLSLHRKAGEALEELSGENRSAYLSQLAHHFFAASALGDAEKAVAYCGKAAESAMATLAYEDAARWYRRALDALHHVTEADRGRRYELLMARAHAEWRSSGFGQARDTYREAMREAQVLDSGDLVGGAALGFAQGGGVEHWVPVLEKALAVLAANQGPLHSQLVVQLALARLILNQGDARNSVERARGAIQAVRQAGDPETTLTTLWPFHRVLQFDPQALGERLAVSTQMVELAKERHDGERLFRSRSYRVGDLFETGDIPAMERELVLLDEDAQQSRLQYFQWVVAYMRAAVALHRGRVQEAEALAHRAVTVGDAVESSEVDNIFVCQMLEIRRQQGRFEDMKALARSAHQQFPHEILVPISLALALVELDCADDARQELDRWGPARDPQTLSGSRAVSAWAYLADVAWAMSDAQRAAVLWDLLRPFAGRHLTLAVAGASLGSTDRSLGRLATLLEQWDEAEACFRSAHAMHERLDARAWLAHGKMDHARMLVGRGAEGDDHRARELLAAARAVFRELGMTFYEHRARALLDGVPDGVPRRSSTASIKRVDDAWVLEYAGSTVRLRDSKGLRYLAALLTHPGRRFSAVELIGGEGTVDMARARHRVAAAVKSAIDRIADGHPQLGEHLRMTVRVGTTSSYIPDARAPVAWAT